MQLASHHDKQNNFRFVFRLSCVPRYKLIKEIIIVKLKRKDILNEIKSMAEGIMQLSLQVVQIYTPIVNRIISDTSVTQHEVEYLMDYTSPNRIYSINLVVSTSKEEQTAIANVLSSMDKEIETLNTKLEKYRNLKTAMMQQLLTGKIRL